MDAAALLKRVKRLSDKTPGEFPGGWQKRFDCEELERLAVRTVDAGLSDAEALQAEGLSETENTHQKENER